MSDIEESQKIKCEKILISLRKEIRLLKNEHSSTIIDEINGLLKKYNMYILVKAEANCYLATVRLNGYSHSVTYCREFVPPAVNESKNLDKCASFLEKAKKNAILGIFSIIVS